MKKRLLAVLMVAALAAMTACSSATPAATGASSTAAAEESSAAEASTPAAEVSTAEVEASVEVEPAAEEDPAAGFEEFPIWEDEEVAFMNVNGVYFQPVPMSNGNENFEDFDMHFEADVSVLEDVENGLGYGPGDWVPYLTVDYEIYNADTSVTGTFMPMAASDGPHYGANIKLPDAGLYSVKLTFHSPEENGYLIHLDDVTGPGGTLDDYDWPLVLDLQDVWEYTPREW